MPKTAGEAVGSQGINENRTWHVVGTQKILVGYMHEMSLLT